MVMYMGIVVYAPSLALATVTGLDYHASVLSGLPTNPVLFFMLCLGKWRAFLRGLSIFYIQMLGLIRPFGDWDIASSGTTVKHFRHSADKFDQNK